MKIIEINDVDSSPTWDVEVADVHEYVLSNGCVSHNTSGSAINATESIEPIQNMFYKEEGTMTIPTLVPNFRKNNKFYKKGFDCDQYSLMELGAIRQMYIDQAQSMNMYVKKADSFKELMNLHLYAFDLGIKTAYYMRTMKDSDDSEECESCS